MDLALIGISTYDRFEQYLERLWTENYTYDRFVAMVLRLPRAKAVDFLRRASRHPRVDLLCQAIDLLARLSPLDACPRCFELLLHSDQNVRRVAIQSLQTAGVACEDAAVRHLETEPDGDARVAWVELLEGFGTDFSIAMLRRMAESDPATDYEGRPMRFFADRAIGAIERRKRLHDS